jgi:hypothetical protein
MPVSLAGGRRPFVEESRWTKSAVRPKSGTEQLPPFPAQPFVQRDSQRRAAWPARLWCTSSASRASRHTVGCALTQTLGITDTVHHALVRLVIGSAAEVPITEAEYGTIKASRSALLEALFLEEKFDLVVQNYLELERDLLGTTVEDILTGNTDWAWFQAKRGLLNRRLLNLLSATRGYIDHYRHAVHALQGNNSDPAKASIARLSQHYDSSLGYRVLEALRNYSQHRGFPVHALELGSNRIDSEVRNRFKFGISIFTKTSYLREDRMFKASVLNELEQLGGRVDIKPLVRDYVGALAECHESLRKEVSSEISQWEETISDSICRYQSALFPESSLKGLAAVIVDGHNRTDAIPIFSEFIEYRRHLAAKNTGFKRLGVLYVSGETM